MSLWIKCRKRMSWFWQLQPSLTYRLAIKCFLQRQIHLSLIRIILQPKQNTKIVNPCLIIVQQNKLKQNLYFRRIMIVLNSLLHLKWAAVKKKFQSQMNNLNIQVFIELNNKKRKRKIILKGWRYSILINKMGPLQGLKFVQSKPRNHYKNPMINKNHNKIL